MSQLVKSKRVRSVSVEDDMSITRNAVFDKPITRPRAKTLPRNLGRQHQNVLEASKEGKPARKPPPPPIPTRPPAVMQYRGSTSSPLRTSQSSLHSGCSSTPSIPEDSVSPPISPHVTPLSPDSCIPETISPEQTTDTNKSQLYPDGDTTVERASGGLDHKSHSKGLFSTLKRTFHRHSKNPGDERRMTYSVDSETEPIAVSHRRVKTVKEVPTPETKGIIRCVGSF